YTELFTRLGKIFVAQTGINTARGTTLPPLVADILDEYDEATLAMQNAVAGLEAEGISIASIGGSTMSALKSAALATIRETLDAEVALTSTGESAVLTELINRMIAESESVDASTVGVTPTADGGNEGNGVVVVTTQRIDTRVQENS